MITQRRRYCEQNPSTFESADTAFILSFAIIMLNTDLHNPGIKPERKMSLESFLKTCKRATTELSDETLSNIYERIKNDEITLKEVCVSAWVCSHARAGGRQTVADASL